MNTSIATIEAPEFINLTPLEINPLMSSCEIKVLYVGKNRNGTFISKDTASNMAKTLRGAPIVGYFKEEKDDFADHGNRMVFDDEGVTFECLTVPYGFVSPDSKVWFKKFNDVDSFGNEVEREYLMTTGYIWTEQFEEAKRIIESGNNQSMELDGDSLDGRYEEDTSTGTWHFVITDATFSKLCILGEDVEPCFEGANITTPEISSNFSLEKTEFKRTLYNMMQDLKFALEGGDNMENNTTAAIEENAIENLEVTEAEATIEATLEDSATTTEIDEAIDSADSEYSNTEATEETTEEDSNEEATEEEATTEEEVTENEEESESTEEATEDDSTIETEDNADIASEFAKLTDTYNELLKSYNELVEFKHSVEAVEKDKLIESFYMLSEEDKKEVLENKKTYSLDEIEAKLSVLCFRKKINFSNEATNSEEAAITYNAPITQENVPEIISALRTARDSEK